MGKAAAKEINIPNLLKIGAGTLDYTGEYLKGLRLTKVVILFGNGLIDMFGDKVMTSLKRAEVEVLEYQELDTVCIDDLIRLAFTMPNKAQAVIGLGGGKVIDRKSVV